MDSCCLHSYCNDTVSLQEDSRVMQGALLLRCRYDCGRFIQQSYYGRQDGSDWNGKPWRWGQQAAYVKT